MAPHLVGPHKVGCLNQQASCQYTKAVDQSKCPLCSVWLAMQLITDLHVGETCHLHKGIAAQALALLWL